MSRPVIALLTDFGCSDHYAGTMKGVMLSVCPDATLVDIAHEVPVHDVLSGALELSASYRYFPAGTIFLAVIDPGVGSSRRGIAAEAGDYRFVAPDNGILTMVFDEIPPRRVVELSERRYARPTISRTFEGRDRFAPAAAWLAKGIELTALGRPAAALHRLEIPKPSITPSGIDGEVVRVDRFGNLLTNIDRKTFESIAAAEGLVIQIGSIPVGHVEKVVNLVTVAKVVSTYADIGPGEVCALFGSSDHLEITARATSAAILVGAGRGAAVHVGRRA